MMQIIMRHNASPSCRFPQGVSMQKFVKKFNVFARNKTRSEAKKEIVSLKALGYITTDLPALMPNETKSNNLTRSRERKIPKDAAVGAGIGVAIGAGGSAKAEAAFWLGIVVTVATFCGVALPVAFSIPKL